MPQVAQDPATAFTTVLLVAVVWGCFGIMAAIVVVLLLAIPMILSRRRLPRQ
jgi:ABC-type sugar transport system permease subunit